MATPDPNTKQYVHFPRSWDDRWSKVGATDLYKAKVMLYDFELENLKDCPGAEVVETTALSQVLRLSESPGLFKNVAQLATMIQERVFQNHHEVFFCRELLHRMRFILLKCYSNLPKTLETDHLRNFFFDPSVALHPRNIIPSGDTIVMEVPQSMLKIVIIGGGPTGLLAAINLAERVRCWNLVQIHVYDKRWEKNTFGELEFTAYPEYQRRRDQVVTLQDHVMKRLSKDTTRVLKYGLRKRGFERVWPDSSNHQISKIEDSLLKRAQDSIFDGVIHLHSADITDEATLVREAGDDFHLLLGTNGANSWVRKSYFSGDEEQCGRSFALGVALDRGERGLPRLQALNVFLTLCQMRFMLNASDRYGTGYLNMLLTEQEYNECISLDGSPADFRSPAYIPENGSLPIGTTTDHLFAPYHRSSILWQSISDGLHLFGFKTTDVKNIVRIPINLIGVKTTAKGVSLESVTRRHKHCLVSLAGDAALTHHFWSGRGMNSGIKAAIAWSNQVADLILERNEGFVGLNPSALDPFIKFMKRLREREHAQRSLVVLNTSGSPERMLECLWQAHNSREDGWIMNPMLRDRVLDFAKRLEGRSNWPHKPIKELGPQVMRILAELRARSKAEMVHTGPWRTAEMSADEVHPPEPWIQNLPRQTAEDNACTSQDEPIKPTPTTSGPVTQKPVWQQLFPSCSDGFLAWACAFLNWLIVFLAFHISFTPRGYFTVGMAWSDLFLALAGVLTWGLVATIWGSYEKRACR